MSKEDTSKNEPQAVAVEMTPLPATDDAQLKRDLEQARIVCGTVEEARYMAEDEWHA